MEQASETIQKALDILSLPPLVTKADIKKQYRYLAKKYHPDQGGDPQKMEKINSAYTLLLSYIEHFRYTFDDQEVRRQIPGVDYVNQFKV